MSISVAQINTQGIRVFMGTLTDGVAVHEALAAVAERHAIHAATFELLGGLSAVELTAYDFARQTRHEPLILTRPLEILSGHGAISRLHGAPHVHTHLTLAFRDPAAPHGVAVIGGHAARAVAFAVEFTLTAYDGVIVRRQPHPTTGLLLWDLPPLTDGR